AFLYIRSGCRCVRRHGAWRGLCSHTFPPGRRRAACGLFMQALVAFVLLGCESQKSCVPSGGPTAPRLRKPVVGLLTLLTLACLGAHPRIRKVEELLGVRQVITAGFPFVALGVLGRHPAIGVLTDSVLEELTPILQFALGWLGFLMGFQF